MPRDSKLAITSWPSVVAELDAQVPLSWCVASWGVSSRATRSQRVLPVLRSTAITMKRCGSRGLTPPRGSCDVDPEAPEGIAVVRNTWSPHTTGEDEPRPGISTFQLTFFVSLHSVGGSACGATPVARGPRHCGQLRSAASSAELRAVASPNDRKGAVEGMAG